jgi:Cytochrome c oxidase subunit IV
VKLQALLWVGVAVYFGVIAALYVAVGGEAAGITLLLLAGALGGLIGGWAWARHRRDPTVAPADRPDADMDDETGVVGIYPSASLRPLALGTGMGLIALGVAVGSWMTIAGVAIVASQVALLTRDADPGRRDEEP